MIAPKTTASWKKQLRDPTLIWKLLSFIGVIITSVWMRVDAETPFIAELLLASWASLLLAIGYTSTPSGTWHGKVCFAVVVVTVTGINFKMLALPQGKTIILCGLAGITIPYILWWRHTRVRKKQ